MVAQNQAREVSREISLEVSRELKISQKLESIQQKEMAMTATSGAYIPHLFKIVRFSFITFKDKYPSTILFNKSQLN